jgi:Bacterial SH3 domain
MVLPVRVLVAVLALAISAGAASARDGTTTTELGLHARPGPTSELLLTMPAGASVEVGACSGSWCRIVWNSYSGYASKSGLSISAAAPQTVRSGAYAPEAEVLPVYPRYPYRSGYYPKADWYYQLPPYFAIEPSFYRRHYFMMAQERNRYRYMPHIFHGHNADNNIDYRGHAGTSYDVSPDMMNENKSKL